MVIIPLRDNIIIILLFYLLFQMRKEMLRLLHNFLRCYPDTLALKDALNQRLGPLLVSMKAEEARNIAAQILDDNKHIFED